MRKSIRLTEDEAAALDRDVELTGEIEAPVLKRSFLRGITDERLERAIFHYLKGGSTAEAAEVADLPRAILLHEFTQRGVPLLPYRDSDAQAIATKLKSEGLAEAASIVRRVSAHLAGEDREAGIA